MLKQMLIRAGATPSDRAPKPRSTRTPGPRRRREESCGPGADRKVLSDKVLCRSSSSIYTYTVQPRPSSNLSSQIDGGEV